MKQLQNQNEIKVGVKRIMEKVIDTEDGQKRSSAQT